jgi:hypothetical protein
LGFFLREKRRWLFRNKKNGVGFFAKSALAFGFGFSKRLWQSALAFLTAPFDAIS